MAANISPRAKPSQQADEPPPAARAEVMTATTVENEPDRAR